MITKFNLCCVSKIVELLCLATLRLLWCVATARQYYVSQRVDVRGLQRDPHLGGRAIDIELASVLVS